MYTTIRRGVTIWVIAGMLLLVWAVFAAGVNYGVEDEIKEKIALQAKQERFYQVIAGLSSGEAPGPANRLARDLRDMDAEDVAFFSGDSNRYGGISEELGFDPFNGADCSECGPLDSDVVGNVETIKEGGINEVLEELQDEIPEPDRMVSPPAALGVIWFVLFPLAAAVIFVLHRRRLESEYRGFHEERRLIAQLREAQQGLPPGHAEWLALDSLADNLQEQIDTRVSYTKSKTQRLKITALTQEATSALEDIEAGNKTLD